MDKGTAITNLNNAVRLVYLTYDYAANVDTLEAQRKQLLEQEIAEHASIIINSLTKAPYTTPLGNIGVVQVQQPKEDLSWLHDVQTRSVGDEEVGSLGRSDT